jgi:hypothetical protein
VRVLAVSSDGRHTELNAPTLREQGVDVVLENWRSLVAPPEVSPADRARLERAVAAMVQSDAWRDTLRKYRWSDRYLGGVEFERFVREEEGRITTILGRLGTLATPATSPALGWYPASVLTALGVCVIMFVVSVLNSRHRAPPVSPPTANASADRRRALRAIGLISLASAMNIVLIERAGFVVSAVALFWLSARAFDARHPVRDAIWSIVLSIAAYLLFARLLQISLPAGVLARWI